MSFELVALVIVALAAIWFAAASVLFVASSIQFFTRRAEAGAGAEAESYMDFVADRFGTRIFVRLSKVVFVIIVGSFSVWLLPVAAQPWRETWDVRSRITGPDRLVIRSGGNCHRNPADERVLFETEDSAVKREVAQQISIAFSMTESSCCCCGEMTFNLYRKGELVYSFSLHHGASIRIEDSRLGDRDLTSSSHRDLNSWLTSRGIYTALAKAEDEMLARHFFVGPLRPDGTP